MPALVRRLKLPKDSDSLTRTLLHSSKLHLVLADPRSGRLRPDERSNSKDAKLAERNELEQQP